MDYISSIDEKIEEIELLMESCYNEETLERAHDALNMLHEKRYSKIVETKRSLEALYESGLIDNDVFIEYHKTLSEMQDNEQKITCPYVYESTMAILSSLLAEESKSFATKIGVAVMTMSIGFIALSSYKKWIEHRLSRYEKLHPDIIPFSELKPVKYDLTEGIRYVNFNSAKKWAEDSMSDGYIKLYFYKNRIVMGIAVSNNKDGFENFIVNKIESVVKDSKFKKYENYYMARMSNKEQFFSTKSKEFLKDMKEEILREQKKMERELKEYVNDTFEKYHSLEPIFENVRISVADNLIPKTTGGSFISLINSMHTESLFNESCEDLWR